MIKGNCCISFLMVKNVKFTINKEKEITKAFSSYTELLCYDAIILEKVFF